MPVVVSLREKVKKRKRERDKKKTGRKDTTISADYVFWICLESQVPVIVFDGDFLANCRTHVAEHHAVFAIKKEERKEERKRQEEKRLSDRTHARKNALWNSSQIFGYLTIQFKIDPRAQNRASGNPKLLEPITYLHTSTHIHKIIK